MDLLNKKCFPCEGGTPALTKSEASSYIAQTLGWNLDNEVKKISREFKFDDFKKTMKFVNKVADLSESEGHHPDLHVSYGKVLIELWTHAVNGLSENDFILAAKINSLL